MGTESSQANAWTNKENRMFPFEGIATEIYMLVHPSVLPNSGPLLSELIFKRNSMIIGVGIGPGDPDWLTQHGAKLIRKRRIAESTGLCSR